MKTVLRILETMGGYRRDLHVRVENPPYLPLVIEATPDLGPCGLTALSVAHYGERNGDLMRDPEMCFELSNPLRLGLRLVPFSYRNDYMGVEQFSRTRDEKHYLFAPRLYDAHEQFAVLWDKNLYAQGYLTAFERGRTRP